jgi:hypothetical protein
MRSLTSSIWNSTERKRVFFDDHNQSAPFSRENEGPWHCIQIQGRTELQEYILSSVKIALWHTSNTFSSTITSAGVVYQASKFLPNETVDNQLKINCVWLVWKHDIRGKRICSMLRSLVPVLSIGEKVLTCIDENGNYQNEAWWM